MDGAAKTGAMGVALSAIPEVAEVVLSALGRYARAVVDDADRFEAAEIIALQRYLNAGRVGVERIPDELGDRADRIAGRRITFEKILFCLKIKRGHAAIGFLSRNLSRTATIVKAVRKTNPTNANDRA